MNSMTFLFFEVSVSIPILRHEFRPGHVPCNPEFLGFVNAMLIFPSSLVSLFMSVVRGFATCERIKNRDQFPILQERNCGLVGIQHTLRDGESEFR